MFKRSGSLRPAFEPDVVALVVIHHQFYSVRRRIADDGELQRREATEILKIRVIDLQRPYFLFSDYSPFTTVADE